MKTNELRQKDGAALREEVTELQRAYFNLRMKKGTDQFSDTSALRKARRSIARAQTILAEQERSQANS